ncbi:hypothetical protein B0T10DRAFT_415186 [Thelonectria olida]|uniref:Transmembrane protein n=1 Tax=Thelonectria olida TaxID=1576542 RepID=A0A9P9AJR1_9HYPO|nr:hypothetical protein B0T10DRAFT_415186 [Thelonectria olida]
MAGFLVPPWYKEEVVTNLDMNIASFFWGLCFGVAIFTAAKASNQTMSSWSRARRVTAYVWMIWGEWIACIIISVLTWLYLWGTIETSFWIWFFIIVCWCFQTQLLVQIIVNRLSLLMVNREKASRLKWGAFAILTFINITVGIVWIPNRLQISETWIRIDAIWDRIEKVIFLLVDASLNIYFIYLVRTRLISNGLTKYNTLFTINIVMVIISISMDVVLIGLMSLPVAVVYLQFQCFAYLMKLYIEMNMAELIKKVVRATQHGDKDGRSTQENGRSMFTGLISRGASQTGPTRYTTHIELGSTEDVSTSRQHGRGSSQSPQPTTGIQKTVITEIVSSKVEDDDTPRSESSSTRQLNGKYGV